MSLSTKSHLRFAKLTENAFPPMKGSAYAAGWDLQRYIQNDFIRDSNKKHISLVLMITLYQHEEE